MKTFSGLFILCHLFCITYAQTNWQVLSEPRTWNEFIASSFIDDNEGWLIDDQAILWHTGDGCVTLDTISSGKYFFKLDFVTSSIGYALDETNAYKTTDGGITWSSLTLPANNNDVLYFITKDVGFISGWEQFFKTTDGGDSWITLTPGVTRFNDYFFKSDSIGFAVTDITNYYDPSIWMTIDSGISWTGVYNETNFHMQSVWFISKDTGWASGYYDQTGWGHYPVINKTTNGGQDWTNVFYDFYENYDGGIVDIRFSNNHKHGFALSEGYNSYITTDGGLNWNLTDDTDTLALASNGVSLNLLDGFNDLYVGGWSGTLMKWKKDTMQWQDFSGRVCSDINDLSFISKSNGWMAARSGLLKTADEGDNWSASPNPVVNMSVVDAVNDTLIIAAGWLNNYYPYIFRSTDGGQIWNTVLSGLQPNTETVDIRMFNENTGYALLIKPITPYTYDPPVASVWKSTNGGLTWQNHVVATGSTGNIWAMYFLNESEGWVTQGWYGLSANDILYHTTDGGFTWTIIYQTADPSYAFLNVFFRDQQNGYIVTTGSNFYQTSDGGITWTPKSILGASGYLKILFADSLNGWVLTNYNIYETTDGGTTWTNVYHSEIELYDFEYLQGSLFARGFYGFLVRGVSACMPFANFSTSVSNLTIDFTDQSPSATSWSWDFGDGNTSTLQNPSHTYSTEGTYNACLTITDSCGSNTDCESITLCDPLNTDFLYQLNELSIQMLNQITEATSFFWDFGDGTTSNDQNPLHIFPSSGTYHVCLIEWDDCTSDTVCKDITIIPTAAIPITNPESRITTYPNPFNDFITIKYELPIASAISIQLTDLSGKILRSFSAGNKSEGKYVEKLNLDAIASGTYLVRIQSIDETHYIKIIKQ